MKIYYIWDAYCGWSYGFNQIFKPFLSHHPDIGVKLISGGLFVDEHVKALGDYDYLPAANQAITERYGVHFGAGYEAALAAGQLVLDSSKPATAFALMRDQVAQHAHLDLAMAIQTAFFQEGKSLSEVATYLEFARRFGLAKQTLRQELQEAFEAADLGKRDFEVAAVFGVTSYPTVILEVGDRYAILNTDVRTLDDLEARFQAILASFANAQD